MTIAPALDVVYTWVDDAAPGYAALRDQHARTTADRDPARTRDNLDLLRYSLRSLDRYAPSVGRVFVATQRPQVPAWLDTDAVEVVHHDAFMPRAHLPTFSSFAIVSNLHRIPGVSRRFIYVEDDCFFAAPLALERLYDPSRNRTMVYLGFGSTPAAGQRDDARLTPWNLGLAWSNHLLDARYGERPRGMVRHAPLVIDVDLWRQMVSAWPAEMEATSASRFRAMHTVAPNHHYPHYLLHEGHAVAVGGVEAWRAAPYSNLADCLMLERAKLAVLDCHRPRFFCLNDSFGKVPNQRVVSMVRAWLERRFPWPSRYERRPSGGERGER